MTGKMYSGKFEKEAYKLWTLIKTVLQQFLCDLRWQTQAHNL